MSDSSGITDQALSKEAPPYILAKVYFHALPEEDDYVVTDEKHISGECVGCVPAYIVPRAYIDETIHPMADLVFATLTQDRDGQRAMKLKAREQRDSVTVMLADLVNAAEEVIRISDRKHDAWDAVKAAIAKAKGARS